MAKDVYKEYLEQHTLEEMLKNASPTSQKSELVSSSPSLKLPLISPYLYGILYVEERDRYANEKGYKYRLRYLNLEREVEYEVARSPFPIESVFASEKGVYYGVSRNCGGIVNVLTQKINPLNNDGAYALGEWNGRLLVATHADLVDAPSRSLMVRGSLDTQISSIQTDSKGNLYLTINYVVPLVLSSTYRTHLVPYREEDRVYKIGKPLLSYFSYSLQAHSEVLLIPEGTFIGRDKKEYPFSVIDCIKGNYLRLNKEKIGGTGEPGIITQLKLLHCFKDVAEILYTSSPNAIKYAQINLREGSILKTKELLHAFPCLLEPVTSLSLHQKLMEKVELQLKERISQNE